ncbi:MAG: hypothetical protein H7Y09_03155 [Chitinophagaceae bacterium]|nr:hypothetical protein [Anaerolineae bacterium]
MILASLKQALPIALAIVGMINPCAADNRAGGTLALKGRAESICVFTNAPTASAGNNMRMLSSQPAQSIVGIDKMVDDVTARLRPASISITLKATCNLTHQLRFTSLKGILANDAPPTALNGQFLNAINYSAMISWGGKQLSFIGDGASERSGSGDLIGANTGDISIQIAIDGAGNDVSLPVMAGSYSDVIIIELTPAL